MRDKKYIRYTKVLSQNLMSLRIEYAYELLHTHNYIKVTQILDKLNKVAKTYPYQSEIEYEQNK